MGALQSINESELKESFRLFNQLAKSLEFSYQHLETHIAQLQQQLADEKSQNTLHHREKQQAADRLNAILDVLPAGVVVLDSTGRVQDHNPAAANLLGEPLSKQRWRDVVARAFDATPNYCNDVILRDGRRINLATCPLGSYPGQVILLNDVTDTRLLEDKLNQHQRLKAMGEMAASLAHQIRTPISASILYGAQLKNKRLAEDCRMELVNKVITHMRDLEKIVANMLAFSRNDIQGFEKIDLLALVNDVREELLHLLEERRQRIVVNSFVGNVCLTANRVMLQSAIQNIVINAIHASRREGDIEICIDRGPDTSIEVIFKDNGIGITPELRADIFKPFVTDKDSGTGLGLAVVQAIARAHDGDVYLRDTELGRGSTFALRLPWFGERQVECA